MAVPRDTTLPWMPDFLGVGTLHDLEPTTYDYERPRPAMGFSRELPAPPSRSSRIVPIVAACSVFAPCGWCADCLEVDR